MLPFYSALTTRTPRYTHSSGVFSDSEIVCEDFHGFPDYRLLTGGYYSTVREFSSNNILLVVHKTLAHSRRFSDSLALLSGRIRPFTTKASNSLKNHPTKSPPNSEWLRCSLTHHTTRSLTPAQAHVHTLTLSTLIALSFLSRSHFPPCFTNV